TIMLHQRRQVENAAAVKMMLYDFDFVAGSDLLNVRGQDRLREIAAMCFQLPFPVVIERMPLTPALAEARRATVLKALAQAAFPVPPERVVIGGHMTNPLSGVEAGRIYWAMVERTSEASKYSPMQGGPMQFSGSGSSSSSGMSGGGPYGGTR